jgi:hypothetical protein
MFIYYLDELWLKRVKEWLYLHLLLFIPGEHCETYVKHYQTLFNNNDYNTACNILEN